MLWGLLVFSAVGWTYANHFHNGFHFDDFHTITGNVFIRSLANLPRFFTDPATSSSLPTHRTWRPLVTASLALDYWLGQGYTPLYFHLSTFVWFLAQLCCMYVLFAAVLRRALADGWASRAAWFAVALYGLHPAMSETVNYIIQRADVISTCGVVAGLAVYARYPALRRYGIYLAPVAIALLAKPPALVFPLLLVIYEFWGEAQAEPPRISAAIRKSIPALALAAAFAVLQVVMTPKTLVTGGESYRYWITQPYVAFRYFTSFFLPLHLSADTDLAAFASVWTPEVFGGFAFLAALIYAIYASSKTRATQPITFGLAWFLLALVPTSVFPLAEVENDHRMFFPFVGLTLAVTSAGAQLLSKSGHRDNRKFLTAGLACLLLMLALGTRRRNEIWQTDESLWQDVTIKSPRNGRGWMNYGVTQMAQGRVESALRMFERAASLAANYPWLEINLGIANAALHRDQEARAHFLRALNLDPQSAGGYYYYARWLVRIGHTDAAAGLLEKAVALNPELQDARDLLREIFLYASLRDYQARDYQGCIDAARQALHADPQYAEAYNNIAAAYAAMGRWDQAIDAAQRALRIRPDFQLAQNNLAWAQSEKRRDAAQQR